MAQETMDSRLRLFLDFSPLLGFFVTYRMAGLPAATAVLIICTVMALTVTYVREKRIAAMPLISGLAVTVLGSLTLLLHDDYFIKIKPTLVNLLFASILLVGLSFGKPMFKYVLGHAFTLTEAGWRTLSLRWGLYFIFLAALNECIWRNFPTDFWVNFKVFGMFSLTLLFTFLQFPLIKRTWVEEEEPK